MTSPIQEKKCSTSEEEEKGVKGSSRNVMEICCFILQPKDLIPFARVFNLPEFNMVDCKLIHT